MAQLTADMVTAGRRSDALNGRRHQKVLTPQLYARVSPATSTPPSGGAR
ncbi:MAG: hypothetical protein IPO00_09240 [Betaproteobacteria bacterium]|nr:hypothetical protein [Betaproteobacteria bacterium]